jgi:outer membrane protein OmpA-like peptidoglycan-associated protein
VRRVAQVSHHSAFAALMPLALAACGSPQQNPVLEQARATVSSTSQDASIVRAAPAEVQRAKESLNTADASWRDGADPAVVNHEAYLASQHAAIARETAKSRQLQEQIKSAEAGRQQILLSARTQEADQLQRELQATQTPRGTVITLGNVLFQTNSATLAPGAAVSLDRLAGYLRENPSSTVQVEGYTDSSGSVDYNRGLSQRRADSVREALIARGIDPRRIESRGYGEMTPVASNDTAQGRQMNRRVEVVIAGASSAFPEASGAVR